MAYIITVMKPVLSEHGAATDPLGQAYDLEPDLEKAVISIDYTSGQELATALFNWRPGDILSRREQRIIDVIMGRAFNPIYDGSMVEVEKWGAAQAVNWMVDNGYDPATQDFIPTFNSRS